MSTVILACGHMVNNLFEGIDSIQVVHQSTGDIIRYRLICSECAEKHQQDQED